MKDQEQPLDYIEDEVEPEMSLVDETESREDYLTNKRYREANARNLNKTLMSITRSLKGLAKSPHTKEQAE